jgi:hypothetical protein
MTGLFLLAQASPARADTRGGVTAPAGETGGDVGFGDAVNTQDIAEPIVAPLVGAIGLIAAVPLTTGLAAMLAARVPAAVLPEDVHVHHPH